MGVFDQRLALAHHRVALGDLATASTSALGSTAGPDRFGHHTIFTVPQPSRSILRFRPHRARAVRLNVTDRSADIPESPSQHVVRMAIAVGILTLAACASAGHQSAALAPSELARPETAALKGIWRGSFAQVGVGDTAQVQGQIELTFGADGTCIELPAPARRYGLCPGGM